MEGCFSMDGYVDDLEVLVCIQFEMEYGAGRDVEFVESGQH